MFAYVNMQFFVTVVLNRTRLKTIKYHTSSHTLSENSMKQLEGAVRNVTRFTQMKCH